MNFEDILIRQLPFEPTSGQRAAAKALDRFITSPDPLQVFVLRGYAGTGKTSLIAALVRALPAVRMKSVLLAPTGRAAKVVSGYSGKQAFTVHRKIYRTAGTDDDGFVGLQNNTHTDTIFIVDEASMIGQGSSDKQAFPNSLLEDLFTYVEHGENCRLIFVGDTAQLPPVGLSDSPALDPNYLKRNFGFQVHAVELNEVVRQQLDSGVLLNATRLRLALAAGETGYPQFVTQGYHDLIRLEGSDLMDALEQSYSKFGPEDTIIICRSNKRANQYNQAIRQRIRWQEDEISTGDYVMIVKNNYFWLPQDSKAGFLANGDTAIIRRINKYREMHGFRFADVTIQLLDYPDEPELDTRIILDSLHTEAPALTPQQQQQLFESVAGDYADLGSKGAIYREMKKDEYFNALQVKFAYAVTCHKAQGGQWASVFIEQGYLTEEMLNADFLRWLYTGITRTTDKVYLINFNKEFYAD